MPILNYTTSVPVEKSAQEIQTKLVKAKATAVMSEYSADGILTHISFRLDTPHGPMSFRLPANVDGVYQALKKERKCKVARTREQAAKVAWRIVKDWVEAQIAIIQAEMATPAQVFLPYAQDAKTGKTLYEVIQERGMDNLLTDQRGAA